MSLIIDVGHQGVGIDPGAVGNGIIESEYTLKISLYQYNRFKELGVPVQITRTTDKKLTNNERTSMIRKSGAKHCMSNHINAGGGDGAEVIHSIFASNTWGNIVADELKKVGQNVRRVFSKSALNSKVDYYFMHRETGNVETIIVEYGFLDSKVDDVVQLKQDWKKYAEAVVKAYCTYAGYKYTSPKEKEEVKPVTNKPSKWAEEAVKWAMDNKLSDGARLQEPATREEVITMMYNLYKKLKG